MSARKLTVFTLTVAFFSGAVIFSSCGDAPKAENPEPMPEETAQEVNINDLEGASVSSRKETIKKIFYTIPAPMEMASLIKSSGADYDSDVLNSVDNIENYITKKQQAINLGVYGADLSYTTMFERTKESLYFFSATKALAEDLGVGGVIDDNLITRVEANKEQKDSLLSIVSDTFWSLNAKFKDDGMEDYSALLIAGGWIEGLYLASNHVEGNDELRTRIAEQKYSLDDLVKLIGTYDNQDNLADMKADLEALQSVFADVEINKSKTETSKAENGTTVIGGASSVTMSDETLAAVISKITELRAKYIQ
ncbi:MAG: hypothetical protein P8O05_07725 [Flavobacteriales bacterium]|nr:hypothetical protein [Flavobacteriales bacterium]